MATNSFICSLRNAIIGRRIVIPPIQRDYAWNVGNTATQPLSSQSTRLFEDFQTFIRQRNNGEIEQYFLGNLIVVVENGEDLMSSDIQWQLLDGQQRVTSLALMMKAFHYQLDTMNNDLARDLQNQINEAFLVLDQNRCIDVDHPYPIRHRRRVDRRYFKRFMAGHRNLIENDTNMGRVCLEYCRLAEKYETALDIQNFVDTVLDHVLVSVTITDNITMGYQMFQTANGRGLPLTSYDMFRAFVVKKIESDFINIPNRISLGLHDDLNELETVFQGPAWGRNSKEKEKNLKKFMSAYMSMRAGRHLRESTIINTIEIEINAMDSPDELEECLYDMEQHATLWRSKIHPGRPLNRDLYEFRFIRRVHRMGVEVAWGSFLSFVQNRTRVQSDWLLSVVEWSLIKQLLIRGQLSGSTEVFSQLAFEMNKFWDPTQNASITSEDFEIFRNLWLNERIPGDQLNTQPQTFDDQNHCFYALLHRLENQDGLASADPGRNAQTTTLIRLMNKEYAGDGYEQIGNFFLTPGSHNNGITHTQKMTHEDSDDLDERILTVLANTSVVEHNMQDELRLMDENQSFEEFIALRTTRINQALNQKYQEFMLSDPPLLLSEPPL